MSCGGGYLFYYYSIMIFSIYHCEFYHKGGCVRIYTAIGKEDDIVWQPIVWDKF